ncbi:MAG TPA: hypothetical protein VHZ55_10145 [Bryobacteraceae bacterium]|nr:hypothetical protein [Bryobacteraceae bacterium]
MPRINSPPAQLGETNPLVPSNGHLSFNRVAQNWPPVNILRQHCFADAQILERDAGHWAEQVSHTSDYCALVHQQQVPSQVVIFQYVPPGGVQLRFSDRTDFKKDPSAQSLHRRKIAAAGCQQAKRKLHVSTPQSRSWLVRTLPTHLN